jgi:hypothetical protein
VLSTASYSNNLVHGNRLTQAGTDKHRNILTIVAEEMSTCFSEILKQYFKDGENIISRSVRIISRSVRIISRAVRNSLTIVAEEMSTCFSEILKQ